jgi:sugar transferase (PEP-CTERM/EpsH1 system associated)
LNLLFLTPQIPFPPRQGTAIRNWGLIRHLAARHAITLLSFAEPGQSADAPELRAACRRVIAVPAPRHALPDRLRTLLSSHPDLARRRWSPDYARALIVLLRESVFDIVHIEGLEMAPYLSLIQSAVNQQSAISNLQSLYDAHNAEYLLQRRALAADRPNPARWPAALYSWIQISRLRNFEAGVCRVANAVICVSAEDAAALQQLVPALHPVIVPNGIDVEDYVQFAPRHPPSAIRHRLVFTGKMDYRPNVDAVLWFASEILPRIRAVRPEVEFVIVGQEPAERVQRLNGQNGVVVMGAVDDVRPFIAGAAVYTAPLRMGGGTRFKLLEAMALARPIVSTTLGAEGFPVTSGRELMLADSPAAFGDAVLALLADPARADALGQAGRAFVRARFDWGVIIPKFEALYEELGARRMASGE